jgi:MYXO-CTERM domain-containing protein
MLAANAAAYTVANQFVEGCHERLTSSALRVVRGELVTAGPLSVDANEQALVNDLPFAPDDDMRDLGAVTLLLAVRDADLKGHAADDLSALAEVHGDPSSQREHCLRAPAHQEPGGSLQAVAACRAFIRERAQAAIAALDVHGAPDLGQRTQLTTHLSLRGTVHASLPTYYLAAGAAIHAIQDSFTHTYRTPGGRQITVVLTWFAVVNGNHDEARDGPAHASALDRCDDPDELRQQRRLLATTATADFMRATLDPSKDAAQKMSAVDALLDKYLGAASGCTFQNDWCDAPERQYKDPGACGCRVGPVEGRNGVAMGLALLILLALLLRRRGSLVPGGVGVACILIGAEARAQGPPTGTTTTTTNSENIGEVPTRVTVETTPSTTTTTMVAPTLATERAPPPPVLVPVAQPGPTDLSRVAVGAYAGVAASVDKPADAWAFGARLRASRVWSMGLDLEWNPWIAFNGTAIRKGAANLCATGMLRFPLAYERFNLRAGFSVGASYLLTDLYGAPAGSLGLYLGASPLAIEWKVSRWLYLIINPISFALPVPRLDGLPLLYPQYRTTVGFEVYAP